MHEEKQAFATLDGLRGLAALAVVLGHMSNVLLLPRLVSGLFAVDLFFVMSGFVVAYAYESRLAVSGFGGFAATRAIRLYPLYLAGTLLGALVAPVFPGIGDIEPPSVATAIYAALMLPAPGAEILFPLNPVAWSLFFEAIINLLYGVTWRLWTIRNLCCVVVASAVALLTLRGVVFHTFDVGWSWANAVGGVARVSFGFPLGVLLFRLHQLGLLRMKIRQEVILLLTMAVLTSSLIPGVTGKLAEIIAEFVLVPVIVISAINTEPRPRLRPLYIFAGAISYSIYALHYPILICLVGMGVGTVFVLPVILLLCWAAHSYFDVPVRRLLMRLSQGFRRGPQGRLGGEVRGDVTPVSHPAVTRVRR
jgi:peptidoglycan/LPS O-acetylase OafA/YrhL